MSLLNLLALAVDHYIVVCSPMGTFLQRSTKINRVIVTLCMFTDFNFRRSSLFLVNSLPSCLRSAFSVEEYMSSTERLLQASKLLSMNSCTIL